MDGEGDRKLIELWHLMLIGLSMWLIYGFTKPIVRPTINDIRFKKMVQKEIDNLVEYRTHHGLDPIIHTQHFMNY